ncbi:MAG: thioredoxin [Betaproteobacteria bacterium]|nr:thioredoxin [Betaproteobacteria bacterium]
MKRLYVILILIFALMPAARAQVVAPYAIDIPKWFTETFLDFREDVRDAAKEKKRLLVYFGQDGCPYCTELMQTSFTQPRIVEKTRKNFVAVSLNVWGDREITWIDGKTEREKDFAKRMKVQFTPTILILDEKGAIAARLNGYYPPHRMEAALDYAAGRLEKKQAFADYMRTSVKEAASETLHDEAFFLKPPYALARKPRGKPLAVIFESKFCSGCDEMHGEGFRRPEVARQIERFDVARLALGERTDLVRPDGKKTTVDAWVRELKIAYTPTIVFFGENGREAFRVESYVRPFHLAASFEYVASGAYRREPSLQRFIQTRAEQMRERGQPVELWK